VQAAHEPVAAAVKKGGIDDWQIVTTVDEAPVGSALDALVRREQAQAVLELAALARRRAVRRRKR
jgi:hypothetical protein